MKFLDEFRDSQAAAKYVREIARVTTGSWTIMEVCGGQTHAILRNGIDTLLPSGITLLHGPGCPVCVTPTELIDQAVELAARDDITFCSFGDMLRVPGSESDLLSVKAAGGDVRTVYSPLDAVALARENPDREVVFFAVGFETTAPVNATAVAQARAQKLANFSILSAQVLIPPAMAAVLESPESQVQGFLAAGHVCAVMGCEEYEALSQRFGIPVVVTGFEPTDILQGLYMAIRQLEEGRAEVENQYARAVQSEGNVVARRRISEVFRVVDRRWRGFGMIPSSGLALREEFAAFDAAKRFTPETHDIEESSLCVAGLILQGRKRPDECPAFGTQCTPEHPLGATMVSSEGACAAYYRYHRNAVSNSDRQGEPTA